MCVTYRGPDTRYSNREICFNPSETAVGVADLSDKSVPSGRTSIVSSIGQGLFVVKHRAMAPVP